MGHSFGGAKPAWIRQGSTTGLYGGQYSITGRGCLGQAAEVIFGVRNWGVPVACKPQEQEPLTAEIAKKGR